MNAMPEKPLRPLPPRQSLYDMIGGEDGLRRLVETFYDIIEQDKAAEHLHLLHLRGHGVGHSRIEQFNFLSGFLGGPKLYTRKYGHARLREVHEHIPIGPLARDLWLASMEKAITRAGIAEQPAALLMKHFRRVAEDLRNQE